MPLATWLEDKELPLLKSDSGERMEQAFKKRQAVVKWLNEEIRKAFIEMKRGIKPERFYWLKKYAMAVRTHQSKQDCAYWCDRVEKTGGELINEYIMQREQRRAQSTYHQKDRE